MLSAHLNPLQEAVKAIGARQMQDVKAAVCLEDEEGTPQEGRSDCLRIAVGAAQEVPRGLTAARRPDELVQDLIRKITTRSIDA